MGRNKKDRRNQDMIANILNLITAVLSFIVALLATLKQFLE